MRILLDRLADTPTDLSFEADGAWWRAYMSPGPELPAELEQPLRIALRAHTMGEDLYLEGTLVGELPLECGRCLARYRHALHEPFRVVLEPSGTRVPADPEGARALVRDGMCLGEDVETGWYRGSEIELAPFFHEVVATTLPVQPLCREDCAGLCPRCGGDRNLAACDCSEFEKPSPFAVLEKLRAGRTEGEA